MQNMMTIVTVSDMDRSVRFYRDTIGLALRFQSPDWSEFAVGPTTLALHSGGAPAPPAGKEQVAGRVSIGFNVENVDKLFAELQGKGVRVLFPPTDRQAQGIRITAILDPDGLPISLAQTTHPQ
jgi:lactoylglutathione lyase